MLELRSGFRESLEKGAVRIGEHGAPADRRGVGELLRGLVYENLEFDNLFSLNGVIFAE